MRRGLDRATLARLRATRSEEPLALLAIQTKANRDYQPTDKEPDKPPAARACRAVTTLGSSQKALQVASRRLLAKLFNGPSIRRECDDHSPVVMDEPPSFNAMVPRDEIDAGTSPRIALMMEQRLRLFAAQV